MFFSISLGTTFLVMFTKNLSLLKILFPPLVFIENYLESLFLKPGEEPMGVVSIENAGAIFASIVLGIFYWYLLSYLLISAWDKIKAKKPVV